MGGGKGGGSGKALAYQIAGIEAAQKLQSELLDKQLGNQQQNYDFIKKLLQPYTRGGEKAFSSSLDLLGLGSKSQQQAIDNLTSQDYFKGLVSQGENALLQNASATGGLRGGNTQAALAQFRPNMVSQLVQQQLANLGGISGMGLNAANSLTGATADNANAINNFYGGMYNNMGNLSMQMGNAYANQALMKGSRQSGLSGLLGAGMQIAGLAGGLGWQPFGASAASGFTGGSSISPNSGVRAFLQ